MILYWIIFLIISFFAIKDWKRTCIIWMPLHLLFNESVCLKYTSPAISFVFAVDFLLFFLFYVKKRKYQLNNYTYFFKTAFIAYLISYGISMLFSIVPFTEVFANTIKYFIQNFIIVYLFQRALYNKEDIKLFLKTGLIVVALIISLGLYETIFKDNPVLDYVYLNAPKELILGKMYYVPPFVSYTEAVSMRFGLVRAYSFFGIHIAFGCASILLFYLYFYFYNQKNNPLNKKWLLLGCILLITGVFMCNSKTPLLAIPFFVLATIKPKSLFNPKLITSFIILIILISIYAPEYFNNFKAIFDSKLAEQGGGSNTSMRIQQFEVGLNLFCMNPLWGNGVGAIGVFMKNASNADLLGAESSWLKILPERGLIGAIVYLILYQQIYIKLKTVLKKKEIIGFLVGLMIMETATGFMDFALYGSIIICLYRFQQLNKSNNLPQTRSSYKVS